MSEGDSIAQRQTIYLAVGNPGTRQIVEAMIKTLGHELALVTDSGRQLIDCVLQCQPDLCIATPILSDMDGIEALIAIGIQCPTASVLIARDADLDKVERAMEDHVMAYLVEPITAEDLVPAIYLSIRRFRYFQSLRGEISKLETQLEQRKMIEKAKGIIMQTRSCSEAEAHRFLQQSARSSRQRLADIAKKLVEADNLLHPPTTGSGSA